MNIKYIFSNQMGCNKFHTNSWYSYSSSAKFHENPLTCLDVTEAQTNIHHKFQVDQNKTLEF